MIQPKFVFVRVLQKNRTNRMYVYTERKKLIFKELTHAIIGIGKSNICREGQQAEDLGKGKCCVSGAKAI